MSEHHSALYRDKALPTAVVERVLLTQQRKLFERFERAFEPQPGWRILDLGTDASLTRREDYFVHTAYAHPERITAAGLEASDRFVEHWPECEYVQVERGADLPFEDGAFDAVFCNAVVEHVGTREQQAAFVAEACRVGRRVFLTTPNRWYPIELHTVLPLVHYLPPAVFRRVIRRLGFEFFSREENLNLLDRRALGALAPPDRRWRIEQHRFLGLPSNLLLIIDP